MHVATSKTTGDLGVSNATVVTGQVILTGVSITVVGADTSVVIYDNTAASGRVAFRHDITFDDTFVDPSQYIKLPDVKLKVGMHVVVTGANAVVIVHYR